MTHRRTVDVADQARKDIIKWLADGIESDPDTVAKLTNEIVGKVADKATEGLFRVMERESKKKHELQQWRKTVNNHFLCSILADLSCEIMELEAWIDMEEDRLVSKLVAACKPRSFISDILLRVACKIAVDEAIELAKEASNFKNFQRAIRLSAIMSCPDPEVHEEVLKCCVIPLEKDIISDRIKRELVGAMPTSLHVESVVPT